VALVGASGCGKSSVMKLIERFYDPNEGRLLYNNIDLKEIDNKWYH
jgi:ATP-binding cassette subfamily B (MDR/TAP) protein 1